MKAFLFFFVLRTVLLDFASVGDGEVKKFEETAKKPFLLLDILIFICYTVM